jgi:hypothetical protein
MSYDIGLYKPEFLRRAIEQNLGEWTRPDPIPEADMAAIVERLLAKGYVKKFVHPQLGDEYTHPDTDLGIQVSVYPGSVDFTVPYWVDAARAVAVALADAQELARLARLALYDPQSGEVGEMQD